MGKVFYNSPISGGDFGLYILDCILRLRFFAPSATLPPSHEATEGRQDRMLCAYRIGRLSCFAE